MISMTTNERIKILIAAMVIVFAALWGFYRYDQCLKEKNENLSKYMINASGDRSENPLLKAPGRGIELTDRQIEALVEKYWEVAAPDNAHSIRIGFKSVCSLKLKEAFINKYRKKYTVLLDSPPERDPCGPQPQYPDPYFFSLDLKGIDANTVVIGYSDGLNFGDELFRWDGTSWQRTRLSAGSGLLAAPECPEPLKK